MHCFQGLLGHGKFGFGFYVMGSHWGASPEMLPNVIYTL